MFCLLFIHQNTSCARLKKLLSHPYFIGLARLTIRSGLFTTDIKTAAKGNKVQPWPKSLKTTRSSSIYSQKWTRVLAQNICDAGMTLQRLQILAKMSLHKRKISWHISDTRESRTDSRARHFGTFFLAWTRFIRLFTNVNFRYIMQILWIFTQKHSLFKQ